MASHPSNYAKVHRSGAQGVDPPEPLRARSGSRRSPAWYDPRQGAPAFRIEPFNQPAGSFEPARTNYFAIVWIRSGRGTFSADAAQHAFGPDQLLFFVPYQYLRFDWS